MDEGRYAPPKAAVADIPKGPVDVEAQRGRLRWASHACLVFAAILLFRFGNRIGPDLPELVFVLAMALGIRFASRVCAMLMLLDFLVNMFVWSHAPMTPFSIVPCIAIFCCLGAGTIAAFQYHRLVDG